MDAAFNVEQSTSRRERATKLLLISRLINSLIKPVNEVCGGRVRDVNFFATHLSPLIQLR